MNKLLFVVTHVDSRRLLVMILLNDSAFATAILGV